MGGIIDKISKFLGKSITQSEKEQLLDHLSFERMKTNPYINLDEITQMLTEIHGVPRKTHFFRKGMVGTWKEELSDESIKKMDKWIENNKISGLWEDS